jgi:hypothetical protein
MIDSWQDYLTLVGIFFEIVGFVMILKSEGMRRFFGTVDPQNKNPPSKVIIRPKLLDGGIWVIIAGLILQFIGIIL